MTEFPIMRGNARVARGAGYFEVPLFSLVLGNLWQGCSPSEYLYDTNKEYRFGDCGDVPGVPFLMDGDKPRFDRILNLYPWGEYAVPDGVVRHTVTMYDSEGISDEVDDCAKLVNSWLDEGYKVLVHCQAGLNRSSLVIARYLMMFQGMTARQAIEQIRETRSEVCLCNEDFESYLLKLDRGEWS